MAKSNRTGFVITTLISTVVILDAANTVSSREPSSRLQRLVELHGNRPGVRSSDAGRGNSWLCRRGYKLAICHGHVHNYNKRRKIVHSSGSRKCSNSTCIHGRCLFESCRCERGWVGRQCHIDINECMSDYPRACDQVCRNTPGSFECLCVAGYLAEAKTRCVPAGRRRKWKLSNKSSKVESLKLRYLYSRMLAKYRQRLGNNAHAEWNMNTKSGPRYKVARAHLTEPQWRKGSEDSCKKRCTFKCSRRGGDVECLCPEGYSLASDEISCIDRNECLEASTSLCPANKECRNTIGSFVCVCRAGYTQKYKAYAKDCEDLNECLTGEHTCGHNSICRNTIGSYACSCLYGYNKMGTSCVRSSSARYNSSMEGRKLYYKNRSVSKETSILPPENFALN